MEINVDSLVVVKAIEDGEVGNVKCVSILRRIINMISEIDVVVISHVFKNANMCADKLATRGCLEKSFVKYDITLDFLCPLLEAGALGTVTFIVTLL